MMVFCNINEHVNVTARGVTRETTGPIWLKFISKVLFMMAIDVLGFDYCIAICVAMVAISNEWQLFHLVKRLQRKVRNHFC